MGGLVRHSYLLDVKRPRQLYVYNMALLLVNISRQAWAVSLQILGDSLIIQTCYCL